MAEDWFVTWWDPTVECRVVWDGRRLSPESTMRWPSSLTQCQPYAHASTPPTRRKPTGTVVAFPVIRQEEKAS